mmetsp:Transcript_2489/g.3811  ORF Transcript_2489/g.3811 Transcript_2489/m.3811 type:complete len:97 (-) Transcript_2489:124-414(-)
MANSSTLWQRQDVHIALHRHRNALASCAVFFPVCHGEMRIDAVTTHMLKLQLLAGEARKQREQFQSTWWCQTKSLKKETDKHHKDLCRGLVPHHEL